MLSRVAEPLIMRVMDFPKVGRDKDVCQEGVCSRLYGSVESGTDLRPTYIEVFGVFPAVK